ncbi:MULTISPECIES: SDR family NAD(P)-dependent oxidoreductase [Enterococcus]|uniref:2-deoxy-D-gluconate 3-dehydrogenase n=1 Tax=Candidatus Enterococcus ferrettii TaxID=2815324 RepID=A0ABV0EZ87_9ENTE|nr:SDR family oxidoreductase [Enterococcus sp. 665A]MBO1338692.1 SDR family oxidoreductase [Enterococcus sp. 665A]
MEKTWLDLAGDVVIITGALGGMGRKIANDFAEQGAKLALVDLNEEATQSYAKELNSTYGVEAKGYACNSTVEEQVDALAKAVKADFGRIDVLVQTAAILTFSPLEDLALDEWKRTIDVNLTGYFLVSQRVGRVMIEQQSGRMVHISTIASLSPETYSGAYSPSKAGVNMLSKMIAGEWGQYGVRSNCVLPCFVKTPLSTKFYEDEEVEEGRRRMTANRRIGEVQDIANAVLYLASKRSDYTNGHELRVEGGFGNMIGDLVPKPGGRRQYAIDSKKPKN